MTTQELAEKLQYIALTAQKYLAEQTEYSKLPINYACIFAQSDKHFIELTEAIEKVGKSVEETYSGSIYQIAPIETVAGALKLVKVRAYDKSKNSVGYADFTLPNYDEFKEKALREDKYDLFTRKDYEVIGLYVKDMEVGVYFMNPPMDKRIENA